MGSDLAKGGRIDVGAGIGEVGVVESVVGFSPELNEVFVGPRHQEALGERHIEIDISWPTQVVAIADFTAKGIGQGGLGSGRISEQLDDSVVAMNAGGESGTGACEHGRAVKDETDWESAGVGAEGKAGVRVKMVANCQPPIRALTNPLALGAKVRPRPNGKS